MGNPTSPKGGTTRGLSYDDHIRRSELYSPSYPGTSSKRAKTKREAYWNKISGVITEPRGFETAAFVPPAAAVFDSVLRASGGLREASSENSDIVDREDLEKMVENKLRGDTDSLFQFVGERHSGGIFGELALINNKPRAATITTLTDSHLATIDRRTFQII